MEVPTDGAWGFHVHQLLKVGLALAALDLHTLTVCGLSVLKKQTWLVLV